MSALRYVGLVAQSSGCRPWSTTDSKGCGPGMPVPLQTCPCLSISIGHTGIQEQLCPPVSVDLGVKRNGTEVWRVWGVGFSETGAAPTGYLAEVMPRLCLKGPKGHLHLIAYVGCRFPSDTASGCHHFGYWGGK